MDHPPQSCAAHHWPPADRRCRVNEQHPSLFLVANGAGGVERLCSPATDRDDRLLDTRSLFVLSDGRWNRAAYSSICTHTGSLSRTNRHVANRRCCALGSEYRLDFWPESVSKFRFNAVRFHFYGAYGGV